MFYLFKFKKNPYTVKLIFLAKHTEISRYFFATKCKTRLNIMF